MVRGDWGENDHSNLFEQTFFFRIKKLCEICLFSLLPNFLDFFSVLEWLF